MNADKYYGSAATGYDAQRMHRPDWALEQQAVTDMVKAGPVLDCPVGTGRYVQIYKDKRLPVTGIDRSIDMIAQAKRKHPDLDAGVGTILDLPFNNKTFGTAVCSRLLNWLYPQEMATAMGELRRVAEEVVCSIRLGEKGMHSHQANYTHSRDDFLYACQGLFIEEERIIHEPSDGRFVFVKLRQPTTDDVRAQFKYHQDGVEAIQRLSRDWCDNFGIAFSNPLKGKVKAEFWDARRIGDLLDTMAATPRADGLPNEMHTDQLPKRSDRPITVVRFGDHDAIIDGRRRSNLWRHTPGLHPVLILEN